MNNKPFNFKNLQHLNPVKQTCNHLLGHDHTERHRMGAGVVFIISGVLVSKLGTSIHVLHLFFDGLGYMIHAFGTIPFIEALQSNLNNKEKKEDDNINETK